MSRSTCWSCGTTYTGWTCPICTEREETERRARELRRHEKWQREENDRLLAEQERLAEEAAESAQEAAWRMEEAVEEQREAIARAPFLQANALAHRAYELLQAHLVADALHHARQALNLDRGHLLAHKVAGSSLTSLGAHHEARRHYKAVLALLSTSTFASSPSAHSGVIDWLPDDPDLLERADTIVMTNAPKWTGTVRSQCFDVLDMLIERHRHAAAFRLVDFLLQQAPDLLLHSYRIEIAERASAKSEDTEKGTKDAALADLDRYLAEPDRRQQRAQLLTALRTLSERQFVSKDTLREVRRRVATRYREWHPEIVATIAEENAVTGFNLGLALLANGWMAIYLIALWHRPRWSWNTTEEFVLSAIIEFVLLMWLAAAASGFRERRANHQRAVALENAQWEWTRSEHAIASGELAIEGSDAGRRSHLGRAVLLTIIVVASAFVVARQNLPSGMHMPGSSLACDMSSSTQRRQL